MRGRPSCTGACTQAHVPEDSITVASIDWAAASTAAQLPSQPAHFKGIRQLPGAAKRRLIVQQLLPAAKRAVAAVHLRTECRHKWAVRREGVRRSTDRAVPLPGSTASCNGATENQLGRSKHKPAIHVHTPRTAGTAALPCPRRGTAAGGRAGMALVA